MSPRFPPINLGAPGEEISKKDLFAIAQRFKHFNLLRLQRAKEFLQPRQQDFLHLLPLLLHINHPLLPGFVSSDTPAGIPDYVPAKQAIETARQFSRGFVYKRKALKSYPIQALYLMGSIGSMGFTHDSDIDIWLCHHPELNDDELNELRKKAHEVEKWAASLRLEVHIFLLNSQQFRKGENTPLSVESSGQTQHYLLLEEFYRTSIYIAGRIPAWWLVPPGQQTKHVDYVAHLLENRFISENDVIEFGGLEQMPLCEFVSATIWHLYKSLTSPHKALLKLFLMESYASEYPSPQWLCQSLKQAIYSGDFSVDSLDPYMLIYGKVDAYLRSNQHFDRLELARESFYIKIMGSSTPILDAKSRQLHDNFLALVALRWQWPVGLLSDLSTQKFWCIERAVREHSVVRDQLQQCLRMILKITGSPLEQQLQENVDIKLVSRKLRAYLDQRPGKIEVLTTHSMVKNRPDLISLVELPAERGGGWGIYPGKVLLDEAQSEAAIKYGSTLLELSSWMVANQLYRKEIGLHLMTSNPLLGIPEIKHLLVELQVFIGRHSSASETDLNHYLQANRHVASLLLLNWGEAVAFDNKPEQMVMSERSDPLSYGDRRHCFVLTVQRLAVSSWGEFTIQHYGGLEGLLNCMTDICNESGSGLNADSLRVICMTRGRGRSIAMRVEGIFKRLLQYFFSDDTPSHYRYLLPAEAGYCCFKLQDKRLGYFLLENNNLLFQELASTQSDFSPVVFDDYVLEQSFIPFLYQQNLAETVQIFYHQANKHLAVYILDEKGALFAAQHRHDSPLHMLSQYMAFLKTLMTKRRLPEGIAIRCYEIQRNSAGVASCLPIAVKPLEQAGSLRVSLAYESGSGVVIYCNEQAFQVANPHDYQAVRERILSHRQLHEDYFFYLGDLDVPNSVLGVSDPDKLQSVHFLNYKQRFEEKLNS